MGTDGSTPTAASGPSLRQRKKQATSDRIRHCAVELFVRRGFDAVSIAEIAEAADVSKMTVFNYFPAKEDMLLTGAITVFPDIAGVVRRRGDRPVVLAVRDFTMAELDRRAEWTGLHDGVAVYTRVLWESPTLLSALTRRWQLLREDLVAALAEAAGQPPDPLAGLDPTGRTAPGSDPAQSGARGSRLGPEALLPRLVADQIVAALQTLTAANQWRQLAGRTADDTAAEAQAETETAFNLLERGVGDWPDRH